MSGSAACTVADTINGVFASMYFNSIVYIILTLHFPSHSTARHGSIIEDVHRKLQQQYICLNTVLHKMMCCHALNQ